jgi:hypothetical protein
MTKQEMLEILGIIEELTEKASNASSTAKESTATADAPFSDECLTLSLVEKVRTEDNTTMFMYEGKVCNKLPVLVEIEKHDSEGIRLESLNAIPGGCFRKKFKNVFLNAMHSKFTELQ